MADMGGVGVTRVLLASGVAEGRRRSGRGGQHWLWVGLFLNRGVRCFMGHASAGVAIADDATWQALVVAARNLCGQEVPDTEAGIRQLVGMALGEGGGSAGLREVPGMRRLRALLGLSTGKTGRRGAGLLLANALTSLRDALRAPAGTAGPSPDWERHVASAGRVCWIPERQHEMRLEGMALNAYPPGSYALYSQWGLISSHLFEQEALARGLSTERLHVEIMIASDAQGRSMAFDRTSSDLTTYGAGVLTIDKQATRRLLQHSGLPVPEGRAFPADARVEAMDYAHGIGFPVVVKPVGGARGEGVVAGIADAQALACALDQLSATSYAGGRFIVEKHVQGNDYRFFATPNEVLSVVLRRPASVVGDGESSIVELVLRKNLLRRDNPHLRYKPIRFDAEAMRLLSRQGVDPMSVPEAGRTVSLCSIANLSRGGDSVEVLDETHPSVLEVAMRTIAAIPGLPAGGVDILLEDHRLPITAQRAGICEVNSGASLALHLAPVAGQSRKLARRMVLDAARAHGLALEDEPRERLQLRSEVEGSVDVPDYIEWIVARGRALGLDGHVRVCGTRLLEVLASGPTQEVVELVTGLISGWHQGARPERVCTSMSSAVPGGGFHVVG